LEPRGRRRLQYDLPFLSKVLPRSEHEIPPMPMKPKEYRGRTSTETRLEPEWWGKCRSSLGRRLLADQVDSDNDNVINPGPFWPNLN
jgi:hypothetical protein